uniref:Uncharacterized protein n=1 Tax=Apteryx owenii TaxID=8824 RepID=A0A8B9QIU4_APTOW
MLLAHTTSSRLMARKMPFVTLARLAVPGLLHQPPLFLNMELALWSSPGRESSAVPVVQHVINPSICRLSSTPLATLPKRLCKPELGAGNLCGCEGLQLPHLAVLYVL